MKTRQFEDDIQLADSMTNNQVERITQMEAEYKQLVDKLNDLTSDLEKTRTKNLELEIELEASKQRYPQIDEQNQQLRLALQQEEENKMKLQKHLEEKDAELTKQFDELRRYKVINLFEV